MVLAASILCVPAQNAQSKRGLVSDHEIQTSSLRGSVPRWAARLLVGYEDDHTAAPVLYTVDRDGKREEILFTFPDASVINISDVAASADGELAIIGGAETRDGRGATFIARIAPDHKRQVITRVWPYCPGAVTFAPDGTVWTIGHLKDEANTREIANHVLRRFDPSGRMLSSTVVDDKAWQTDEISQLRASRDRVGWFTRDMQYIEFSLDGSETGRYALPADPVDSGGAALSEDNDVVIGTWTEKKRDYVILDRESGSWTPISLSQPDAQKAGRLLGFDGATLVTHSGNTTLRCFKFK
jgi:hypothetical protein